MKKGNVQFQDGRPRLEVLPDRPKTILDRYKSTMGAIQRENPLEGGRGRPRRYQNKEELLEGIEKYFEDIIEPDGRYNRPPTWFGLGIHLGFSKRTWDQHYRNHSEFRDVIEIVRDLIDVWKHEQTMVPSKGVNPAGVMYAINMEVARREEEREAMKDITPGQAEDTRPKDAAALIDDVWRKKDGQDVDDNG